MINVNLTDVRNNARFYEVVLYNDVRFTGTPKSIMDKFKFTASDWNRLHARKQDIDGITIRPYGRIQLLFQHKGFIGTREEIIDKFNYKAYVIDQRLIQLVRVGYFFDCDAGNRVIVEEEKPKPVVVNKKKVDSPNQAYIDYLFESTFKGWRA